MSAIVHHQEVIERQIIAMGVAHFDVATRKNNGETSRHDGLFLTQLWGLVDLLRERNTVGQAVLIRPHGEHGMSLISGLNYEQVNRLKLQGFSPAIVVQYGRDHYQAWLRHDGKLDKERSERVAKHLAQRAGGDLSVAHWDSYGYLANFEVPEWVSGKAQEAQLIVDSGQVYDRAAEFLAPYRAG